MRRDLEFVRRVALVSRVEKEAAEIGIALDVVVVGPIALEALANAETPRQPRAKPVAAGTTSLKIVMAVLECANIFTLQKLSRK